MVPKRTRNGNRYDPEVHLTTVREREKSRDGHVVDMSGSRSWFTYLELLLSVHREETVSVTKQE